MATQYVNGPRLERTEPVVEADPGPPGRPSSSPPPSAPGRERRALTLALGCALPLLAGALVAAPWWPGDMFDSEVAFWTVALAGLAMGLLGGFLLRSRWAFLVVPGAWLAGAMTAIVVTSVVRGDTFVHFWDTLGVLAQLAVLPLAVCGGVGGLFGEWRYRDRQSKRQADFVWHAKDERERENAGW